MHRFSSAHVLSVLALFVALTGSAIAVKTASVGTKQLKDGAVKESKLGKHAVTETKLADDAVTGVKVDESTLGQVPSAGSADSAATADTATNAAHATSAANATSALTAGNATLLAGRNLQSVRPSATGVANSANQLLDPVAYVDALTVPVDIPAGGADLIVNASFTLTNTAGAARQAQCSFTDDSAAPGEGTTMIIPVGISANGSLTAFVNNVPATPAGNPQHVNLRCQGDGVNGDVHFEGGSLDVLRVPIG
jgi:hypothetical protein